MTSFVGDLMYPNGKYIHRESGDERTQWLKCGGVFKSDDGKMSVKIDAMPTVMESQWFQVFTPREDVNSQRSAPAAKPAPTQKDFEQDDIPF
jgi:hypothetical protein